MFSRIFLAALLVAAVAASARASIPLSVRQGTQTTTRVPTTSTSTNKTNGTAGAGGATSANTSNTTGTNGTNGSNDSVCFPASATVTTFAGAVKRMDELAAGDRVHVGRGQFSEVFMFTHKTREVAAEFVVLEAAASGARVALTPGHYLYVNGGLAAAKTVVVGDAIELADGSVDTVSSISSALFDGLYNPQTLQGDIVVNGVRASTYTTAVEPVFAHAILSPLRAVYRMLGFSSTLLNDGSEMVQILPSGNSVY